MADTFNALLGLGSHSADANLEGWWPLQDDAANTVVADQSGNGLTGTLIGGDNTADKSAAGPNGWLAKALHLNGSDDAISLGNDRFESDAAGTFLCFIRFDSFPTRSPIFSARRSNGDQLYFYAPASISSWAVQHYIVGVKNDAFGAATSLSADTWYPVSVSSSGTAWTIRYAGADETLSSLAGTNSGDWFGDLPAATHAFHFGTGGIAGTDFLDGRLAGCAYFSRSLSGAEKDQYTAGPEPVTASEQGLSGTAQQGETLTATPVGWGLPSPFSSGSNGSITYTYRWTRSDDNSGTNEADISGATSATYSPVEADVSKYLRCWITASNDGGNDPDADTATPFTDAVSEPITPVAGAGRARLMKGVG